ncbi:alpha-amylase [Campylobacterota bacterium]|nr:alpha-amylase [Campylobacterota bacterium]
MPVGDQFKGLPLAELIGGPLVAVCDAQAKLAYSQLEFINCIAYEGYNHSAKQDKSNPPKTRLLEFNLNRPVETPSGEIVNIATRVEAPFLGLVPIPSLLIDDVDIEFQMEVSATENTKETENKEGSVTASGSYGFGFFKAAVNVQGKVSSSRENTRSTNQTAKYQVKVSAHQQRQTEGLSRLMDIMAQCVAPLPITQDK